MVGLNNKLHKMHGTCIKTDNSTVSVSLFYLRLDVTTSLFLPNFETSICISQLSPHRTPAT